MDGLLPWKEVIGRLKRRYKNSKPYWNNSLHTAWKRAHKAEKAFVSCKNNHRLRARLRADFQLARNAFDKMLRGAERYHQTQMMLEIETLDRRDPKQFWEKIKNINPRKKDPIPKLVKLEDGSPSEKPDVVRDKWYNDFRRLFNSSYEELGVSEFDSKVYTDFLSDLEEI